MHEVQASNQASSGLMAVVATILNSLGINPDNEGAISTVRPIFPTAIYDEDAATAVTGTSISTRFRAVKQGKLKCRRAGSRRLYLGSDLLAWLKGGEDQ